MDLECCQCKLITAAEDVTVTLNTGFVPYMTNYVFTCAGCHPGGHQAISKLPNGWDQILLTTLANLTSDQRDVESDKKFFSLEEDIIPFIRQNWEAICTNRSRTNWCGSLPNRLAFRADIYDFDDSNPVKYALSEKFDDLSKLTPSLMDSLFRQSDKKFMRDPHSSSGGAAALSKMYNSKSSSSRGTKRRSDLNTPSSKRNKIREAGTGPKVTGQKTTAHGYPLEHPHNKDGYRYILAERDPSTSDNDLEMFAGKPVPGHLYRVACQPVTLLALHDRAPQLKVSDDRLTVTGDKGYCMIRANHGVASGRWYYEVRIDSMPEKSACRIGWSQSLGVLQAPCGYDKFSYSWRSRKGTFFHQSCGRHYAEEGYGVGDVLGFFIHLANEYTPDMHLPPTHKEKALIKFKNFLYYEEKDYVDKAEKGLTVSPGSQVICFKNGVSQGIARTDIYSGRYYPAISLFRNASVTCNFGPDFDFPPEECPPYQPMSDVANITAVEQSMADLLFHVETVVDGEAGILKKPTSTKSRR